MTISLAFLAPNVVKAAVEGRLPRGISIERLRDPPSEWSRQFEALGLKPEWLLRSQRSRITATQKADLRGLVQSDFTLKAGRRERNFWMRRQGAKNRHRNA
jgi:hypothetical protein